MSMNYQQSYPGMWLGAVVPRTPVKTDADPEQVELDALAEEEYERERLIDEARERAEGRYDDC